MQPVTGWVVESWLGRHRSITVGFFLSMTEMLLLVTAFIMLQFSSTLIPAFARSFIALLIGSVGIGIISTILLPFTLDQMIGASGDELSAAVQWCYWGVLLGLPILDITQMYPHLEYDVPTLPSHTQYFLPISCSHI